MTNNTLPKNASLIKILTPFFILLITVSVSSCNKGPESLSADERPIPAQLAPSQRDAARKLAFEGAHNFRDLGGYKTNDGYQLKWGLVYRSGRLTGFSAADEQYMERLKLRRIVDFRSTSEREAKPDRIAPDSSIAIEPLPIEIDGLQIETVTTMAKSGTLTEDTISNFLLSFNRDLIQKHTNVYRQWLQSLLKDNALPLAFHCNEGKDRSGLGAALLLLAVGVPKETVMQDYLASNTYTKTYANTVLNKIKWRSFFQVDTEKLRPVLMVDPQYIGEAFKAIDEQYGSIENYMEKGLGLDPQKRRQLKSLLTEKI